MVPEALNLDFLWPSVSGCYATWTFWGLLSIAGLAPSFVCDTSPLLMFMCITTRHLVTQ